MSYQSIEVRPLAGNIGAEIFGPDLSRLTDEVFAEIHDAFMKHCVIFFRDQDLTLEDHYNLVRRFGPLLEDPFIKPPEGQNEVTMVAREPHETHTFGESWHTDTSYMKKPPAATLLYALEVPPYGGDTLFANQYLAYETLSPGLREVLDGLVAIHDTKGYNQILLTKFKPDWSVKPRLDDKMEEAAKIVTEHPLVRTHPITGRKALYMSRGYTRYFKGWAFDESRVLIDWLADWQVKPEFTCRFRWEKGSLAIWDNRCALHKAMNDYRNVRRIMRRIMAEGDKPQGPALRHEAA